MRITPFGSHFGVCCDCAMPPVLAPFQLRGGRGARHATRVGAATPSGRAPSAPRWTPAAAAAAEAVLNAEATLHNEAGHILPMLMAAVSDPVLWASIRAAIVKRTTMMQAELALAILDHHLQAAQQEEDPAARSLIFENANRARRRRAAEGAPFPSIGIAPAPIREPVSFMSWIDKKPAHPCRTTPAASEKVGPLNYMRIWDLRRVPAATRAAGVIVFGRAGDRVRKWRATDGGSADGPPPLQLATALIHTDHLPTALGSRPDHYWLAGQERWMSVLEVCRSMGLPDASPLTAALRRVPCPTTAVEMCGNGIHAGVARRIVSHLDAAGHLPAQTRPLRYASACSGCDFFADAVRAARPDSFRYMHAAECASAPRAVLADAWGLSPDAIFEDAASDEAASAPEVDLFVASPSCKKFSKRRRGRDADTVADGGAEAAGTLGFVMAGRAAVVVLENVADHDGGAALTTILRKAKAYEWSVQELSAREHAGVPVERVRRFWVGIRRTGAPAPSPTHPA